MGRAPTRSRLPVACTGSLRRPARCRSTAPHVQARMHPRAAACCLQPRLDAQPARHAATDRVQNDTRVGYGSARLTTATGTRTYRCQHPAPACGRTYRSAHCPPIDNDSTCARRNLHVPARSGDVRGLRPVTVLVCDSVLTACLALPQVASAPCQRPRARDTSQYPIRRPPGAALLRHGLAGRPCPTPTGSAVGLRRPQARGPAHPAPS